MVRCPRLVAVNIIILIPDDNVGSTVLYGAFERRERLRFYFLVEITTFPCRQRRQPQLVGKALLRHERRRRSRPVISVLSRPSLVTAPTRAVSSSLLTLNTPVFARSLLSSSSYKYNLLLLYAMWVMYLSHYPPSPMDNKPATDNRQHNLYIKHFIVVQYS